MRDGRTSPLKRPNASWRRISSALVLAAAFALPACQRGPTILDRLQEQVTRYPDMQTADAYKFVHQAAFGNGHLITDEAEAREYLRSEIASVSGGATEPLVEDVSPDGSVIRINLRPFKASGLDVTKLGDVMIESAKTFTPNRERFEEWWSVVANGVRDRKLPFEGAFLRSFAARLKPKGYPAVHHSEIYAARYQPAYRVVLRDVYLARFR